MTINREELRKLALDVYNGVEVKFSEGKSGEDVIRKAILNECGGKFDYYSFKQNKYKVFAILSEVLTLPTEQELDVLLGGIVSTEHVNRGDRKEFKIKKPQSFKVAKVAAGTQDVRRQEIAGKEVITIETDNYAVKVFCELEDFLAERVDFATMIDEVKHSFQVETVKMINKVFADSVSGLRSEFKVNGTLTEEDLIELINKIQAATQMKCAVYGTKLALSKIASLTNIKDYATEDQKKEYGELAHFGKFFGTDLVELAQQYDDKFKGTVKDDELYILPVGMDLIKVVYEGDPIILDTQEDGGKNRNDLALEFFMEVKMGVAMLVPNFYGVYTIA